MIFFILGFVKVEDNFAEIEARVVNQTVEARIADQISIRAR
jgi:hypothetical protein